MNNNIVIQLYEAMDNLQIFTRYDLEMEFFSKDNNSQAEKYIDELLFSPAVRHVFELYLYIG